eukprot:jgi/Bigna1/73981/fgenesh1_pg.27_\
MSASSSSPSSPDESLNRSGSLSDEDASSCGGTAASGNAVKVPKGDKIFHSASVGISDARCDQDGASLFQREMRSNTMPFTVLVTVQPHQIPHFASFQLPRLVITFKVFQESPFRSIRQEQLSHLLHNLNARVNVVCDILLSHGSLAHEFPRALGNKVNNSRLVATGTLNGGEADIVVLDGLRTDGWHHQALEQSCHCDKARVNIIAKSLAGKEAFDEVRRHAMHPWTLEQHLAASKDKEFRTEVCAHIDCPDEENEFSEKLREKFHFAGHSARWMFATDAKTVKDQTNRMVDKVGDAESLLKGNAGHESADAINHLVCTLKTPGLVTNEHPAFVSKCVLKLLVIKHSFLAVKMGCNIAENLQNPSFMGWVVEMDFLAQLKAAMKTEDKKVIVCDSKNAPVDWKAHAVHECETTGDLKKTCEDVKDGEQVWAVPLVWNNAAFDAVRIHRFKGEKVLHLIDVADAKSHTLKMHCVSDLAKQIGAKRTSFSAVHSTKRINEKFVWMRIVPGQMHMFRIGETSYFWPKNDDVKIHCNVFHFERTSPQWPCKDHSDGQQCDDFLLCHF